MLDKVLKVVNSDKDLRSDNIVEKIEKALGSRLIELASQLSGTHDQGYDAFKEKLKSWRESEFSLDYQFDSDIGTLLHIAAGNNYVNIIKPLKDKGADINIQNEHGRIPLHEAAKNGCKEVVLSLIENGADVNAQDEDEATPLHKATESGCKEVVLSLIENGADVNAKTKISKNTPLHFARNAEITELLIKNGASVNEKNIFGVVPLHEAVQCKVNILELATKPLLNLFAEDKDKNISLHNDNHVNTVKALLQARDLDINAVDERGLTSLHLAVVHGCTDTVKALLQAKGVDVNAVSKDGYTPLHLASLFGCTDTIKVLLQVKGVDVNAASKDGYTPLHFAALHFFSRETINALIEGGADPLFKSKHGETPIDLDESGYIKQFLEKKAVTKGLIAGCSTAALGVAIAVVLFATDNITSDPSYVISAVVIVAILAFAAGGVTYGVLKPNTKMDATEEAQKGNGNVPEVA